MNKNKLLIALAAVVAVVTAAKVSASVNLVDVIYANDGTISYEHTVRSDKQTKIVHSNLSANGTLLAGGIYTITGARTLTLPAGPKVGDSVKGLRGDNGDWATAPVTLTNGSDAALIEDSTSNYIVNGTGTMDNGAVIQGFEATYVGTDDGWHVNLLY